MDDFFGLDNMLFVVGTFCLCLAATAILCVVTYYSRRYYFNYWARRGLRQRKPAFPFHYPRPEGQPERRVHLGQQLLEFYHDYPEIPVVGIYINVLPVILVTRIYMVNMVMHSYAEYFLDRPWYHNNARDPMFNNLFTMPAEEWRRMHRKTAHIFTNKNMRFMYPNFHWSARRLHSAMLQHTLNVSRDSGTLPQYETDNRTMNLTDVINRYVWDVIMACAFGRRNWATFDKFDPRYRADHQMLRADRADLTNQLFWSRFEGLGHFFGRRANPNWVENRYGRIVRGALRNRFVNDPRGRFDFIQLIYEAQQNDKMDQMRRATERRDAEETARKANRPPPPPPRDEEEPPLTDMEIQAAAYVFLQVGFDQTASVIKFCAWHLAQHPEMQARIRQEISSEKSRFNEINYSVIAGCEYLDRVVKETMRLYPPAATIVRRAKCDFHVPPDPAPSPMDPRYNYTIPKGSHLLIPVFAIQRDAAFFSYPSEFNPDRWLNPRQARPDGVIVFGRGERKCVGRIFSLLAIKLAIITMVEDFRLELPIEPHPVTIDPDKVTLVPTRPIELRVYAMPK